MPRLPHLPLRRASPTSLRSFFSTTPSRATPTTSCDHIHLPSRWPSYVTYRAADEIQSAIRQEALQLKSSLSSTSTKTKRRKTIPPTIISFTPTPTYTLGRRQKTPLTPHQQKELTKPLAVLASKHDWDPTGTFDPSIRFFNPEIVHSERGGLTTYHGPGQVVLWPVIDLHSDAYPHLTVRAYAELLADTTRAVLEAEFGIRTYYKTDEPGVWVVPEGRETRERKIAAMGIHLRRHISGLGVAINLDVPVVGDAMVNPWARFVPCGLEDKDVTSVAAEVGKERFGKLPAHSTDGAEFAAAWAEEFIERLGFEPEEVTEEEEEEEHGRRTSTTSTSSRIE